MKYACYLLSFLTISFVGMENPKEMQVAFFLNEEVDLVPLLSTAINTGSVKTVAALLKAGANPGTQGLLRDACIAVTRGYEAKEKIENHIKNIQLLLKYGANPNITWKAPIIGIDHPVMVTPLLHIVDNMYYGALKTAKILLEAGADPKYKESRHGKSLLHFVSWFGIRAVNYFGHDRKKFVKATKLLLRYGADPNAQDSLGQTPLFLIGRTVTNSSLELFKQLLFFGADVTHKDYQDRQARTYAKTTFRGPQFLEDWAKGKIEFKKKKIK